MPTPRVFLIRHGETEWSSRELHTGSNDLALTENGQRQVYAASKTLIGSGKLIQPDKILEIYTSPRLRARQTIECLSLGNIGDNLPWVRTIPSTEEMLPHQGASSTASMHMSDDLQEWNYGDYEGLDIAQVRSKRRARGQSEAWNIWQDGCEGGESPTEVAIRVDRLIANIKKQFMENSSADGPSDVICVAHSHVLSAFAIRWLERPLGDGTRLLLDTAGVAVLSYEHHDLNEPAIIIGPHF